MRKYLFIIFFLAIYDPSNAQSVLGTEYPLGIPLHPATGPSLALGGAGIGILGDFYGYTLNPANLGDISRATFSAAIILDYLRLVENDLHTNHLTLTPQLLSFEFPLGIFGTLGFSVDQRSKNDLTYRNPRISITGPALDISRSVSLGYIENGGTTVWQAGWGYNILSYAYAGLSYERVYYNSETSLIKQTNDGLLDTLLDSTRTSWGGNGIRAGIMVPVRSLTVGLTGEYFFEGTARRDSILRIPGFQDSSTRKFSLKLPPSIGLGVSYSFTPEWFAAADFSTTLWSRYFSGIQLGKAVDDAYSFSAGVQYIPAPNLLSPQYWEIMQYRLGFRYAQMPLSTASEFGITLGAGFPIQQAGGLFDVSVELGRRSDSRFDNFREDFLHLQFGINGGRKWTSKSAGSSY